MRYGYASLNATYGVSGYIMEKVLCGILPVFDIVEAVVMNTQADGLMYRFCFFIHFLPKKENVLSQVTLKCIA